MKIIEGHWYMLRNGTVLKCHELLDLSGGCIRVRWSDSRWSSRDYNSEGKYIYTHNMSDPVDIIKEVIVSDVPEPTTKVVYINVYKSTDGSLDVVGMFGHESRVNADEYDSDKRVGCKRVVFTEGEFDD